jgi:hypothetical protein
MLVDRFFGTMQQRYTVRRMGFPVEFLGMQIEYFPEINSAVLHQEKYILGLARKFGIPEGRYPHTPLSSKWDQKVQLEVGNHDFQYSALVGALLFATVCTRIDIAHATGILTRATQDPKDMHFREARRVLSYLAGTAKFGIVLGGIQHALPRSLSVFVDADWAGDIESRRSTAGLVLFCDFSPVDWRSNKIKGTISLSSTEAEINAIAVAAQRIMFVHPILKGNGSYKYREQHKNPRGQSTRDPNYHAIGL